MTAWLCITSDDNWEVVKRKRVWAVAERDVAKIQRVNVGDFLVIYVKSRYGKTKPRIKGVFEVTSEPFSSKEIDFPGERKFPWRIRIKPLIIPRTPLEFERVVGNLEFIKNKKKWFLYLQHAMRTISEKDFELIKSALSH